MAATPISPRVSPRKRPVPHVRYDLDLTEAQLREVLELAAKMKRAPQKYSRAMAGKFLALLFEKPSLRTAVGFELAIKQMGGDSVMANGTMGQREPVKDMARILGRWVDVMAARVFAQSTVDELAQYSPVPVINALSDVYHPCQALADMQTVKERFGKWEGVKIAYLGDSNNVSNSLMLAATRLGAEVAIASPQAYQPRPDLLAQARKMGRVDVFADPHEAASDAHVVYTDVWTSMGQEVETQQRLMAFQGYCVDDAMMAVARPDAIFMHCLPAHRGDEVTDAVVESGQSAVFDQAENRLHTQKALMLMLAGGAKQ